MEKIRVHAIIKGRVQGVCFRMETRNKALLENVCGWVRNKNDGSVEAVFEGPQKAVENVIKWCHQGPALSKVDDVQLTHQKKETEDFNSFDIRYYSGPHMT